MPRQQRSNNARGRLPFTTIATANNIVAAFQQLGPSLVDLDLSPVGDGVSLWGIPAIRRSDTNALPIQAELIGATLRLTYATPMADGITLVVPSKDQAVRGAQGQYIAAGTVQIPAAPVLSPCQNIGFAGTAVLNGWSVIDGDGNAIAAPNPGTVGSKFGVALSALNTLPSVVTGVVNGSPVAPGSTQRWQSDGLAWTTY